ncbi:MAG: iron ABC transporter permease [Firmicutes bacterium]|nr:iron ABC transporter permease [Bacillota bacterium]
MSHKELSKKKGKRARRDQLDDSQLIKRKKKMAAVTFIVTTVLLAIVLLAAINIGSLKVSPRQLFEGLFLTYDEDVSSIFDLRFPRIVISMLAGAAVAVSGVLFQAVLKNPLADPGIIGISSGAAFFAVVITAFVPTLYFFSPLFACIGGCVAFLLVYSLSWKGGLSPLRIILVGVAINAMFTGLSGGLNSMNGGTMSGVASIVNGNITMKTWEDVQTLAPYVFIGLVLACIFAGQCNLLSLEDKTARSLGVNVMKQRLIISLIACLLASISTAVAGAISFLGLIVPHIGRLLVGSNHKVLIPYSMILGALTFLVADTVGRTIAQPYEVSAQIIMSVVGGPFFIILLRRSKTYGK